MIAAWVALYVGVHYILGPHYRAQDPITYSRGSRDDIWGPFVAFGGIFVDTSPARGLFVGPSGFL